MIDIEAKLSSELGVEKWQVTAAVQLIDEDNTIPFIARYRKEKTGALNDEVLRKLYERLIYLRNLEDKKQQVIATIRDQGKMTDALLKQIEEAQTQVVVDDLYRPYRPKRRTRAMIAKEKGLEKLAVAVMAQNLGHPVEEEAADYVSEEKGVADVKEALEGASDILAESIRIQRLIVCGSDSSLKKRDVLYLKQRMTKKNLSMKCIIILLNRYPKLRDTECWRSTVQRKRRWSM